MKLENNLTCVLSKIKSFSSSKGSGNYLILDKTRVKLFSNFTRHHLITNTNCLALPVMATVVILLKLRNCFGFVSIEPCYWICSVKRAELPGRTSTLGPRNLTCPSQAERTGWLFNRLADKNVKMSPWFPFSSNSTMITVKLLLRGVNSIRWYFLPN